MPYFVYILKSETGDLYVGQTNNLETRLKEHESHGPRTSKYIKDINSSFLLAYSERYSTRLEAMRREKQIKGWRREKKLNLIKYGRPLI